MAKLISIAFSLLLAFCLINKALTAEQRAEKNGAKAAWFESYDKAAAEANKSGKPILADFTGSDWCGWCIKLDEEVFSQKEFTDWAEKNVVLLKVDFPQRKAQTPEEKKANRALAQKYEVEGFPTIVFINAEGAEIGRTGYLPGGAAKWVAEAKKILEAKAK